MTFRYIQTDETMSTLSCSIPIIVKKFWTRWMNVIKSGIEVWTGLTCFRPTLYDRSPISSDTYYTGPKPRIFEKTKTDNVFCTRITERLSQSGHRRSHYPGRRTDNSAPVLMTRSQMRGLSISGTRPPRWMSGWRSGPVEQNAHIPR